jgi:PIN domain nuclease of toxin-antitoxin system
VSTTYLADTHALLGHLCGRARSLGATAGRVLARAERGQGDVRVSVLSLWEAALLAERGRIRLNGGWNAWADAVARLPGLRVEDLTLDDVAHARAFPSLADPADRLIVGTALRLGATLLTADERITRSGVVPVAW